MSRISWLNAASPFPMKRSDFGVSKFGPEYARRLKRRQDRLGDTWHLDEVFIKIQGKRQYLWRAVDQDGDVLDILVQPRRDRKAAKRFFRKLLKGQARSPLRLVTDKLKSYRAAHREVMPSVVHDTDQLLFFTLNREDFSFVIHLDRQPRTSRRREAQTGSRARSGSRSERTLDAVEHSRTLMEWWPFLIFHRGGLRIKVINNTSTETIEPKSRMSRRDIGNDRCGSLNLRDKRNNS